MHRRSVRASIRRLAATFDLEARQGQIIRHPLGAPLDGY
jgi:hypothetical protein